MFDPLADIIADQDRRTVLLVETFETSRQIHGATQHRVVHALGRPDVADHGITDMDAEPCDKRRQRFGFKLSIEDLEKSK